MSEQIGSKAPLVKIYGRLGSAEAYQLRDFLHRCDVPFEWIPLESDAQARLPFCEFPDGTPHGIADDSPGDREARLVRQPVARGARPSDLRRRAGRAERRGQRPAGWP